MKRASVDVNVLHVESDGGLVSEYPFTKLVVRGNRIEVYDKAIRDGKEVVEKTGEVEFDELVIEELRDKCWDYVQEVSEPVEDFEEEEESYGFEDEELESEDWGEDW